MCLTKYNILEMVFNNNAPEFFFSDNVNSKGLYIDLTLNAQGKDRRRSRVGVVSLSSILMSLKSGDTGLFEITEIH